MSMLTINGQVLNTFEAPKGVSRAGEPYGGQSKVQLLCDTELQNGERKADLVTLTVEDIRPYQALRGRQVSVPVGAFASERAVIFYVVKGGRPVEASGAPAAAGA
jgi:hypothetical protein